MVQLVSTRKRDETQLVNVWLWETHRNALQWRRVRVGFAPTHEFGKMMQVTLRWVDAIFFENGVVYLVEAKLRPDAGALGQLKLYKQEFVRTPEFEAYWHKPIKMVFLCKKFDAALAELAAAEDIIYVTFTEEDMAESLLAPRTKEGELPDKLIE